ncbi:MAG: hypothetical protein L0220_07660 [Acidobacteria bacterium]|nr:hypothetical protein [Acidobacteriota bacterium]
MTATTTKNKLNRLLAFSFALLLITGLVTAGLKDLGPDLTIAVQISDSLATDTVGAGRSECAIVAGIAIGIFAAAAGAFTVGIGGALVISAGAHIAGYMCLFS